ncbi:MAG TPA: EAL domain-containing protein [Solimonas sp.]|nr:EAL domain-containing protein [Solimonas sp.]
MKSRFRIKEAATTPMAKGEFHAPAQLAGDLRWRDRLQVKLGLLFAGLLVVLGGGALLAGRVLVRDGLVDETFRYELESGRRLAAEFGSVARDAEQLASALARLSLDLPGAAQGLEAAAPQLVEHLGGADVVDAAGIWPEPHTLQPASERASLYWARAASGRLELRRDYNDPRIAPYSREKWLTPARYGAADRCYWTPVYRELLTHREVVTCAMPVRTEGRFVGAVTVSLALDGITARFAGAARGDAGYSLLTDADSRILAVSENAAAKLGGAERAPSLAELGRRFPAFEPVALGLYKQQQDFVSAVTRSRLYDAAQVSALKDGSRELSRAEAEIALTQVWAVLAGAEFGPAPPSQIRIGEDPVLADDAFASVFQLPGTGWRLVRVTSATQGFSGANYIFKQTLIVVGGAVVLALLLVFSGLRYWVISPLRRMTRQLAQAHEIDDALQLRLTGGGRDEVGALAGWHNERTRQLREAMESSLASRAALELESAERRSAQEQLARVQQRTALALQVVSDAVIATDNQARIEDMNPAAELLTGVGRAAARGRKLGEVFRASLAGGEPLPDVAELALQRGAQVEYSDQVTMASSGGARQPIQVIAAPVRNRSQRASGALVVFRRVAAGPSPALAGAAADIVTGLPTRIACDRRLRELLAAARATPRTHALLFVDVDNLKLINESAGRAAGDQVLVRVAETLLASVGALGEVFRLRADEFAIVLENHDAARARTLATALCETLGRTRVPWEDKALAVTASFGVATFDGSEAGTADLLHHADDACVAAKRAGRNTVRVYEPGMDRGGREIDDATWQRRIRAGLDHNLFHLTTQFLQPSTAFTAEGAVYELLLALEDEEGFWAPPGAFLPAAERHHLLPEVDRWVLGRTIEHLVQHPEIVQGLAFASVNLSAGALADGSLLEFVVGQFERQQVLPASKLCLELREEDVLEHPEEARKFFSAMRSIGCRIAIDHFQGRRSADLAVLRKLDFDFVKIDVHSFRGGPDDPLDLELAETTIRLARSMRRRVIASNLDDPQQWATWRRLGADYFQGFAVARPSPVVFAPPDAR